MQSLPKSRLITVGKVKKAWIREGIQTYAKRLPEVSLTAIKDSDMDKEAAKILSMTGKRDRLMVMAEEGKSRTSVEFAHWLSQSESGSLIFIIGGANGTSARLKERAEQLISLSPLTFPHEIAQILLLEQLYRAKTILQNRDYHK